MKVDGMKKSSSITPTFTGVIAGRAHNKNQNNIDDDT